MQAKVERRRRSRPEQELQISVVRDLRRLLPNDAIIFAIPNGGWRSRTEAAIMQGMGTLAGIPDLAICHQGETVFIELKGPKGTLTDNQERVIKALRDTKFTVCVARSLDEILSALKNCGMATRVKAA